AAMLRALERHYGPLRHAQVISNGRSPERFRPAAKEPFVVAAGRIWDEAKNAAAVARVAPGLPWPVFVAGEAMEPGSGSGLGSGSRSGSGEAFPLSPRVAGGEGWGEGGERVERAATFLGRLRQAEMTSWLSRAAIFAHPARYEPFGLAVLEAALSGCALVLGDLDSLRENWDGAAIFVPPRDDDALAARLTELASNGPLRNALAARARSRALELGADRMAARYLELYGTL
ncbi:MAG TPA: glycosyltransferase, partial [Anaeromyxobacteraceae bacterium]|nr:glycosyltransferase [Anaeromyxobacteraceae bacterium]